MAGAEGLDMSLDDVISKSGRGRKGGSKGTARESAESRLDKELDSYKSSPKYEKSGKEEKGTKDDAIERKLGMSLDDVVAEQSTKGRGKGRGRDDDDGKGWKKDGWKDDKADSWGKKSYSGKKEWTEEEWKDWKKGKDSKEDWKKNGSWDKGDKGDWKDWKSGGDWKKDWKSSWSKDDGWKDKGEWQDWGKKKDWGRDKYDDRLDRELEEEPTYRKRRAPPADDFEDDRGREPPRRYADKWQTEEDSVEPERRPRREIAVRGRGEDFYEPPARERYSRDPYDRAPVSPPRRRPAAPTRGYSPPAAPTRSREDRDTWVAAKRQRLEEIQAPVSNRAEYPRVRVSNIPKELDWRDIRDAFEAETGQILSCEMRDGIAYLDFKFRKDAQKAVETFDYGELNNATISVKLMN